MLFSRFFQDQGAQARVRVETVPGHGAFDLDALPSHERARMASFANAERRRQFVLGRLAARRLLSRQPDGERAPGQDRQLEPRQEPREVQIELAEDGAPRTPSGHLSIAHGGSGMGAIGLAAVADRRVGVDVESIQPRHPGLARRILRPDEAEAFASLGPDLTRSLTLVWSLKEAVLKGQRTGLRAGAQSVRLSLDGMDDGGVALATSERSGDWQLAYVRRGDLWLTVALADGL